MPKVTIHKNGQRYEDDVKDGANLVVLAGTRKFPYPHLSYGCGMGKCAKCACQVLAGAEALPEPLVTPTTKHEAHDRPLSPEEARDLVGPERWEHGKEICL
ncbi:MAG: 2Fe-2S iron-sulfur cluster-binding protein, partial [Curvibacter sp.]